jgi:hypothetical protein
VLITIKLLKPDFSTSFFAPNIFLITQISDTSNPRLGQDSDVVINQKTLLFVVCCFPGVTTHCGCIFTAQ